MSAITLSPELMGVLANLVVLIAGFVKLESRLTKLETTQQLMLDGQIKTGVIERRN